MNGFNTGDWVWMPDQDKIVVAAEVVGTFMPVQPGSLRLDLRGGASALITVPLLSQPVASRLASGARARG
jgi:hypothetical protein